MGIKCTNCPNYINSWNHWEKYENNKKVLEIAVCPDCFVQQCVYNAIKLFVQAPLKYKEIAKSIYPYLLEDKELTNEQKKRLEDFLNKT